MNHFQRAFCIFFDASIKESGFINIFVQALIARTICSKYKYCLSFYFKFFMLIIKGWLIMSLYIFFHSVWITFLQQVDLFCLTFILYLHLFQQFYWFFKQIKILGHFQKSLHFKSELTLLVNSHNCSCFYLTFCRQKSIFQSKF